MGGTGTGTLITGATGGSTPSEVYAGSDAVTIVNMAVGECGDLSQVKRMTAFTIAGCGSSTALRMAYDFYQAAKDQMLAALDWSRARKVAALVEDSENAPLITAWAHRYWRPADALIIRKVIDVSGIEYAWQGMIEATEGADTEYLYTNLEEAYCQYTIDCPEANYNVGMAQLHALYIAEHIAPTIQGSNQKALLIVEKLRRRAERLCLAWGAKEGYVENETGAHELTDLY